jgi:RNA polymerase sigma-70 factor (ECF subfamily)
MKKRQRYTDEDTALVGRVRRGERDAFARLVLKYQDRLYNSLLRMSGNRDDAAELTQEAFLKVLEGFKRFDERSRFSTWLWSIALNLCTTKLRRRRIEKTASVSVAAGGLADDPAEPTIDPPGADHTPLARTHENELRAAIDEAILSLDDEHRQVVVLRDIEKMEYEEIAEALGVPDGTVKSRLHRARLELRARLEKFL